MSSSRWNSIDSLDERPGHKDDKPKIPNLASDILKLPSYNLMWLDKGREWELEFSGKPSSPEKDKSMNGINRAAYEIAKQYAGIWRAILWKYHSHIRYEYAISKYICRLFDLFAGTTLPEREIKQIQNLIDRFWNIIRNAVIKVVEKLIQVDAIACVNRGTEYEERKEQIEKSIKPIAVASPRKSKQRLFFLGV
ncbi:10870_t:CDS:2 [Paraglomus occultum]|uniref:10870_t:CDS:1 n=1 Tax=Paraglomus occultum TaxID=144539 RepID=A0A9N9AJB4_9GLOM|nr:10870_t:CDS:2 [Paraglomus occultum]